MDRHGHGPGWEGSFQYECISAFGGDAAFTAALGAASDDTAAASVGVTLNP